MNHENGTFTLTKADLKALLSCASTDTTRPHLCGVYFEPKTGSVVATDGHALMHVEHASSAPDCKSFIVPRAALERAAKLLKRKNDRLRVFASCTRVQLHAERRIKGRVDVDGWEPVNLTGDSLVECDQVDASFPPYRQVIPDIEPTRGEDALNIAFNPRYIQRAVYMADACDPRVYCVVWTAKKGLLEPVRGTCSNAKDGVTWTIVVMPMRIP